MGSSAVAQQAQRFGLIGPSYTSQSVNADAQSTINWYPEIIESQSGNAPIVLYPTPGTKTFIDLAPGAHTSVRGTFTVVGRTFAAQGANFVEIFKDGSGLVQGNVANDSLPVTFAASPQQLLIAAGGVAYVFDLGLNTLTPIPGATFDGPVSIVGICDDFFIAVIAESKEFYVSAPLDATDWVTNGNAIVSVFPDNIVGMLVDHREIWFWSDTQSVVYFDSGAIFPFDVIPGAFIEAGLAAKSTPVQLNNTVFWLGADARGAGVVWQGYGYTPQRISNHAIEFAIQGYTRIDDAVGFSYQDQGHQFYVLYFPTPSKTWVYDTLTGMWHERGFWLTTVGQFRAAHYWNHTFNFGKHLVGDWQSGKIYQMNIPVLTGATWSFVTDDGNPIRRVRRAPHISNAQKRQFFAELQVYLEAGLGPEPPIDFIAPSQVIQQTQFGMAKAFGGAQVTIPVTPGRIVVLVAIGRGSQGGFGIVDTLGICPGGIPNAYGGILDTMTGFWNNFSMYAYPTKTASGPCTFTVSSLQSFNGTALFVYEFAGTITAVDAFSRLVTNAIAQNTGANSGSGTVNAGTIAGNAGDLIMAAGFALQNGQTIAVAGGGYTSDGTESFLDAINHVSNDVNSAHQIPAGAGPFPTDFAITGGPGEWGVVGISIAKGGGVVQPGNPGRGPELVLRWSTDGGHTWSNEYARDCGKSGQFRKRVRWTRLGRARDMVFEISTADAWGPRIIDGYLEYIPGTGI